MTERKIQTISRVYLLLKEKERERERASNYIL